MIEPLIHSHIMDSLLDEHYLAYTHVLCHGCGGLLHAGNNECMQTWVETGKGNFCLPCFARLQDASALDDDFGLQA